MTKNLIILVPSYGNDEPISYTMNMIDDNVTNFLIELGYSIKFFIVNTPDELGNKLLKHQIQSQHPYEIHYETKLGYGQAYKSGLANIPKNTNFIITCDADGTYPLDKLPEILNEQNLQNSFININRFHAPSPNSFSKRNLFGNKLLTFGINILFQTKLKDSQSGMWIFDHSIVKKLELEKMGHGMEFSSQIKLKSKKNKDINFFEIGSHYYPRFSGEPKLRWFKDAIRIIVKLISYRLKFAPFSK